MKIHSKISILFFVAALAHYPLRGQDAPSPAPTDQITDDASFQIICRKYVVMIADQKTTDEFKDASSMRILVLAHNYLKFHVRPEGKVEWNMRPPDGGMSGASPESVKDPEMRAKYKKMLEENMARSEGQNTYDSVISLKFSLLGRCVSFINRKPGNAKIISDALAKYSKDAQQFAELKRMIVDKAIEQNVSRPEWPESPLK